MLVDREMREESVDLGRGHVGRVTDAVEADEAALPEAVGLRGAAAAATRAGLNALAGRRARTGAQPVRTGPAQRRMVEDAVEIGAADCNGRDAAGRRGDGGVVLVTSNGGGAWSARSSGTTAWLQSVTFTDAGHGRAVGASSSDRDFGGVLVATDGGAAQSEQCSRGGLPGITKPKASASMASAWPVQTTLTCSDAP